MLTGQKADAAAMPEVVRLPPAPKVLAMLWAILGVLYLVFAPDVYSWAQTREHPGLRAAAVPAATMLKHAGQASGLTTCRRWIEYGVWAVYDRPLLLCTSPAQHPGGQLNLQTPQPATGNLPAPKRILIIGASSIQEELGAALEREVKSYRGVEVLRFGRISSGLARPDYFAWPDKLQELIDQFHPDLVLAQWGGNDCQTLTAADGSAVANYDTPEWDAEYARRVGAMIAQIETSGAKAVLLGMPCMKKKSFSHRIEHLNSVTEAACQSGGAAYITLWDLTRTDKGEMKATVVVDGKDHMMRLSDGIHFSEPGAKYMAGEIFARLRKFVSLTPGA
jgi:uncharacterized protein